MIWVVNIFCLKSDGLKVCYLDIYTYFSEDNQFYNNLDGTNKPFMC